MGREIVGIVLVRNEDVFVEQAIRNVTGFCDRIHALDHVSTDGTWKILQRLERDYPQLDARRSHHADDSHSLLEPYAGTETWVFGVDGDELYDPERLASFRQDLLAGAYDTAFKVASNVLNCVELDQTRRSATGYLSPPSRSITKLYNFAAIDEWRGDGAERARSGDSYARPILEETQLQDRSHIGALKRRLRRRGIPEASAWKREKYMRGDLVTVDASPFFS